MTDRTLIQQTEQSLATLKEFASRRNNEQLLEHVQRLEETLRTLTEAGNTITEGDISSSTAVAIGHDISIIVNQVLPSAVRKPLDQVQKQWSASHTEVRQMVERSQGGHIFLSYTREDMDKALQIRKELEKVGHIVWQDMNAIKGGDDWIKSIETGVEHCYALVTVVSETSQQNEWVRIEYLHAKRRGKLIVPIKMDASEIPTIMLATNVIHGHPDLEAGIQGLLMSLPEPPEIETKSKPVDRRALELRYLDSLLLEHSVWQEVYTPMAGVGQLHAPKEKQSTPSLRMKTTPSIIDVGYLGRKFTQGESHEKILKQAEPRKYEVDITPAVEEMRQLVILGDPGAGKTTTMWKILSDHALKAKDHPDAPLPILVQLGGLGQSGLKATLNTQLGVLAEYYNHLLREKRVIFLLDGLNEIPTANREAHLVEIRDIVKTCRKESLILVVTCRELDYSGPLPLDLPGRVNIQPLDPPRIQRFVNEYIEEGGKGDDLFWQLAGGTDVKKAWKKWEQSGDTFDSFWSAENIPRGVDLWPYDEAWRSKVRDRHRSMIALASNPYMLFMITQVFTQTGVLPRNRGVLFQTFIGYLLERRERLSIEASRSIKANLSDLAYAMQAEGEGTGFSTHQALVHLQDETSLYHARSASLLSGGDQVRFNHQLLQEYFAAHHLQNIMEHTPAGKLFPSENWWEQQKWEETLILLAGLYSDDCTPVIEWLQGSQPEVAARCISESGAHCPVTTLEDLRTAWLPGLTDLERYPQPKARAAIGRALGRINLGALPLDNRAGVSLITIEGQALPEIDWVEIPGREFTYQHDEQRTKPPFYMARYPITFAQFQVFLDDPQGFVNPYWWEGLAVDEEHKRVPGEQAFKFSNHPRERVSWYDAVAFCRWITNKAQEYSQLLPESLKDQAGCLISLPTEWEWEKATRGVKTKEYPYPGQFDATKANTKESGIGQTSAVGIFPQGASPYGVLDMSGNVWEWCLNEYDNPENIGLGGRQRRVLRGGSWFFDKDHALISIRFRRNPHYRNYRDGFRVVVRPPSL